MSHFVSSQHVPDFDPMAGVPALLMLCRAPYLYSCQRLRQAANAQGYALDILDPNRFLLQLAFDANTPVFRFFYAKENGDEADQALPLKPYLGVLPRFGTTSTEMGCAVLAQYEAAGVPCLNRADAFRLARDKWQSLVQLHRAGVCVPETVRGGELSPTHAPFQQLGGEMVVKTLSGSQGVGVMLADEKQGGVSWLETLRQLQQPYLAQRFIRESRGEDIRAFVIGDRVAAAMRRIGANSEFRANIHRGGKAEPIALSPEETRLALAASRAMGLDVAGVDLIRSAEGVSVLEVNASAGLEMIEQISGAKLAEQMIAALLAKIASENGKTAS